jgi:D-alanyl-D-alanine carboxypeptidase/D-alanyl-D-alanine-endopeptidase (penicillin-binding protein 4)
MRSRKRWRVSMTEGLVLIFMMCCNAVAAAQGGDDSSLNDLPPPPPPPHAGLASASSEHLVPLRSLAALAREGAKVSALVVDLGSGRPLASWEPNSLLAPASVTKLVLAAALLDRFGPEHTFKSRVLVDGDVKDDGRRLDGDLVVDAAGEPGLTNEHLWRLATDVARLGLRQVKGQLVLNTSRFAPITVNDRDVNRQASWSGSSHAYDGPLSAGAVNFSVVGVFVAPGSAVGQPANVALEPYPLANTRLVNTVKTVAQGQRTKVSVDRTTEQGRDVLRASGTVAIREPARTVYRSVSDPDRYALDVLEAFLLAAGVQVAGKRVDRSEPKGRQVLVLESQPLEWHLRGLLRQSNNFIADMLTIQLDGAERGKTLDQGNGAIDAFLAKVAREDGRARAGLRLESGSGLTPGNRLSAAAVVDVLRHLYDRDVWFGHTFAALPGAGVEGTLKRRFGSQDHAWLVGRLRAKTGTLSQPVVAVGLAGFSRSKSGLWTGFSILVNGGPRARGLTIEGARTAMEEDLANVLAAR